MVLEFVWIQQYGVIKSQGFNFNPNLFYSFDENTGELTCERRQEIPDQFFSLENDTVKSVSGIVGANGTGKSSALVFISRFLASRHNVRGFIKTGNHVISKTENEIRIGNKWIGELPKVLNGNQKSVLDNFLKDTRLIYYAGDTNLEHTNRVYQSLLSLSDEYENSFYTDISDISLIVNDQRWYRTDNAVYSGENPILAHRSGESERFAHLMRSEFRNLIPFSLNNLDLQVRFNDISNSFFESYDHVAFKAIMTLLRSLIEKDDAEMGSSTDQFIQNIQARGIGGFFYDKFNGAISQTKSDHLRIRFYHHLLVRHVREQVIKTMGELTEVDKLGQYIDLVSDLEKSFSSDKSYLSQIIDYFDTSTFASSYTGKLSIKHADAFLQSVYKYKWQNDAFSIQLETINEVDQIFSAFWEFDKSSGLRYSITTMFEFDLRGLSTGERQFLKIFSRFVTTGLNNKSTFLGERKFLILLDEFDIGFHPLWQRRFLTTWIKFLERYTNQIPGKQIEVQLVLTSHSPFIVSDLPKQCLNFLSREEHEEFSQVDDLEKHQKTFGANIHELFSDSFFLKGALMGDWAKAQIQEAINELNNLEVPIDNPERLRKLISLIGEPIIKTKLAEKLAERLGQNPELERLRAQQEFIIKRLKEIEENDSDQTNANQEA